MAQFVHLVGVSSMTYVFVAVTLILLYTLPRFIKVVPAPLIALVVLTAVAIFSGVELKTVGDLGIHYSITSFILYPRCTI